MEKFIVNKGQKLLKSLSYHFPFVGDRVLRALLKEKNVKVNGKREVENIDVFPSDTVEIFIPQKYLCLSPDIVFEDDLLLIVNKPANIEVVSPEDDVFTLTKVLQKRFGEIYPVHRLDTNTTGLVVFAKTQEALSLLVEAFKLGYITKSYRAVVYANNLSIHAEFNDYILDTTENIVKVSNKKSKGWLAARLEYNLIKREASLALLNITLHTGRTHQIRAQLAFHNIFVLGDGKYGDKQANKIYKAKTQRLCAHKLVFNFPKGNKLNYLNNKEFCVQPPFDL